MLYKAYGLLRFRSRNPMYIRNPHYRASCSCPLASLKRTNFCKQACIIYTL